MLNAQEARALSKQNYSKLAKALLKSAIEEMNKQIVQSANDGRNTAGIKIYLSNAWIEENLSDKLMAHFITEGFQIETNPFIFMQIFQVKW